RLVKDVGIKAPRVTRDGKIVTQGKGTEQMWRTMRMLKAFTADELAVMASTEEIQVKPQTAKSYLKHICKAGYITVISTRPKRYRFARWTGCQPPMIQRLKTVFDPNLRQIMWQEEAND
ncbi:MAG: hypothetical protein KAJ75_03470, partial [Alphaproteobacteria bacterium]|nr:hypothetical protein [Alphaproteobacteria bacterium]